MYRTKPHIAWVKDMKQWACFNCYTSIGTCCGTGDTPRAAYEAWLDDVEMRRLRSGVVFVS
jgi:hypothetical protein